MNDKKANGVCGCVAYERFVLLRAEGAEVPHPEVPREPGLPHVLSGSGPDLRGWRRDRGRLVPVFHEGRPARAACGTAIRVVMPLAAKLDDPDICPECVERLRSGDPFREREAPLPRCRDAVEVTAADARRSPDADDVFNGKVTFVCCSRSSHRGPHRAWSGETWETGEVDFVPAPDGVVFRGR